MILTKAFTKIHSSIQRSREEALKELVNTVSSLGNYEVSDDDFLPGVRVERE